MITKQDCGKAKAIAQLLEEGFLTRTEAILLQNLFEERVLMTAVDMVEDNGENNE